MAASFNKEADVALMEAWAVGLADVPDADMNRGVERAIKECKFFPSVAELRDLCGLHTIQDRSIQAFAALEQAVRRHGGYKTVRFDDPQLNKAIEYLGGWMKLCEMPVSEFDTWLPKRFREVYESFARTGAGSTDPQLGIADASNKLNGHAEEPVIEIQTLPAPEQKVIGQTQKAVTSNNLPTPTVKN